MIKRLLFLLVTFWMLAAQAQQSFFFGSSYATTPAGPVVSLGPDLYTYEKTNVRANFNAGTVGISHEEEVNGTDENGNAIVGGGRRMRFFDCGQHFLESSFDIMQGQTKWRWQLDVRYVSASGISEVYMHEGGWGRWSGGATEATGNVTHNWDDPNPFNVLAISITDVANGFKRITIDYEISAYFDNGYGVMFGIYFDNASFTNDFCPSSDEQFGTAIEIGYYSLRQIL